jgi:hypothetical protein
MTKSMTAALTLGVALAIGGAAAAQQKQVHPFPAAISDPSAVKGIQIRDGGGSIVLRGTFGAEERDATSVEWKATLAAEGGAATGMAEIEMASNDNQAGRELDVDVTGLAPSTEYRLFVDEVEIATFTTDANGAADLEFGSDEVR